MEDITFDQKLVELLNGWKVGEQNWPVGNLVLCVIALVLCVVLVGVIGIEREKKGRSAGLRTHLLVGIGSTIVMIISIYGFPAGLARDVARLAAQVITGVGFLGAGAIMHRNSGIKGLTTAGTIWVSMAIGIACGSFNFILAIAGTLLILLVLTLFQKIEKNISKKNPMFVLTVEENEPVLGELLNVAKAFNASVHSLSTTNVDFEGKNCIELTFQLVFEGDNHDVSGFVSRLQAETKALDVHLLSHH